MKMMMVEKRIEKELSEQQLSNVSGVDREVIEGTKRLMRDDSLSYRDALKALLAADRRLAARYRKAHAREMPNYPS